jgi:hypothetical protein
MPGDPHCSFKRANRGKRVGLGMLTVVPASEPEFVGVVL